MTSLSTRNANKTNRNSQKMHVISVKWYKNSRDQVMNVLSILIKILIFFQLFYNFCKYFFVIIVNKEYIPYQFWLFSCTIKQSKATNKEMMEWGPVRYLQKKIILNGSRMQIKITDCWQIYYCKWKYRTAN